MTQLVEVGKKDKRKVSPLNKELYDFASDALYESANNKEGMAWHVGSKDIGNFIDELEKRYDIAPKTDGDNV